MKMNRTIKIVTSIALLLAVAAGGYWYGKRHAGLRAADAGQPPQRTPLYYRNPMGLPDTSPVPKKDAMGMDYLPVYAGDAPSGGAGEIAVDPARLQKLGVKTEAVVRRTLMRTLRLTGRIEADERTLYTIAPRFDGWVERLHANTSGQHVKKGEPLFTVYSPELVSAQRERMLAEEARKTLEHADPEARADIERLAEASVERMHNWEVHDADATRDGRLLYRAPVGGVVLEKKAVAGMRFMAGDTLYRIADLSRVWIIADVPEQDIAAIKAGDAAVVHAEAFPQRSWRGRVDFINPVMNEATRTVPVRIEIPNPDGVLKPAMYAQATITPGARGAVLALPASAVIDSGVKQVVLVNKGGGRFAPREVKLGMNGGDHIEVLTGVAEGEHVVTSAQFLLDSESNLKAALAGFSPAHGEVPALTPPLPPREKEKTVGHQARGVLEAVNEDGTVSITHQPIASLQWPGMTMDFVLANPSLAANLKPGSAITFEIVERGQGEWVVTRMQATTTHEGH